MDQKRRNQRDFEPKKTSKKEKPSQSKTHIYDFRAAIEKIKGGVSSTSQGLLKGVEKPVQIDEVDVSIPPSISSEWQDDQEPKIIKSGNNLGAQYQ